MSDPRNVDELRHAVDSGRTGDKVAYPDPAAAPLGTDAEAGGIPPTPADVELDARLSGKLWDPPGQDRGFLTCVAAIAVFSIATVIVILLP